MSSISATAAKLKSAVSDEAEKRRTGHRVTVVGCGAVGLAGVFSLVNQGIASEIVLIDVRKCLRCVTGATSGAESRSKSVWMTAGICTNTATVLTSQAPIPALQEKLRGEIMDLQHGLAFGKVCWLRPGSLH